MSPKADCRDCEGTGWIVCEGVHPSRVNHTDMETPDIWRAECSCLEEDDDDEMEADEPRP